MQDALALCDDSVAQLFGSALLEPHGSALAKAAGGAGGLRSATLADASTGELASWAGAFGALHVSTRRLAAGWVHGCCSATHASFSPPDLTNRAPPAAPQSKEGWQTLGPWFNGPTQPVVRWGQAAMCCR
jgi:hypothetical protein